MTSSAESKKYIVATDVGGTCTDTIVVAQGEPFYIGKSLSTAPHFAKGVLDSIETAAAQMETSVEELFAQSYLFVHGSTVVDNTLLTRDGSTVGLITTAGFEDTIPVTRGAYGRWAGQSEEYIKHIVATDRPEPLIAPDAICGVRERTDYKGEILLPLDEAEQMRGGLYIPDTAKEKPSQGEVIAVGPGKLSDEGARLEMDVKVGDKVLYGKYSGTDVTLDGEEYLILRESDILAIVP